MLISIITVVWNDKEGLIKTIESVRHQKRTFTDFEYIVIDGDSSDGTVQVALDNFDIIDHFLSEPDAGIYDAMNKALTIAKGEGVLFLNAGDFFVGCLFPVNFSVKPPFFLPVKFFDFFGRFKTRGIKSHVMGISNCHQGIVFENKGIMYDLDYSICSDYKFFLDHGYDKNLPVVLNNDAYVFFDGTGVSSVQIYKRDSEMFKIRLHYFGFLTACAVEVYALAKRIIRKIMKRYSTISARSR